MRLGKHQALGKNRLRKRFIDELETIKARIRAKAEQPRRVNKPLYEFSKVRLRGLVKNAMRLTLLKGPNRPEIDHLIAFGIAW